MVTTVSPANPLDRGGGLHSPGSFERHAAARSAQRRARLRAGSATDIQQNAGHVAPSTSLLEKPSLAAISSRLRNAAHRIGFSSPIGFNLTYISGINVRKRPTGRRSAVVHYNPPRSKHIRSFSLNAHGKAAAARAGREIRQSDQDLESPTEGFNHSYTVEKPATSTTCFRHFLPINN